MQNRVKVVRDKVAEEVFAKSRVSEVALPRRHHDRGAPRIPDRRCRLLEDAEFFSFGTNDLTQTTLGMSRDDYKGFIGYYMENDVVPADPVPDDRPAGSREADEDRR